MLYKWWVKFSLPIHCLQVSEQETTLTYINFLQDYWQDIGWKTATTSAASEPSIKPTKRISKRTVFQQSRLATALVESLSAEPTENEFSKQQSFNFVLIVKPF